MRNKQYIASYYAVLNQCWNDSKVKLLRLPKTSTGYGLAKMKFTNLSPQTPHLEPIYTFLIW